MNIFKTELPGVIEIQPTVHGDQRGFFYEIYQNQRYSQHRVSFSFVQDNLSRSSKGVLRGLHYQFPLPQGKLVTVIEGRVLDVAVDIRKGSPTFGKWVSIELNSEKKNQLFIPPGFAHGFEVLSDEALFLYKCTEVYHPEFDRGIRYNDPMLEINWRGSTPLVSEKDNHAPLLKDCPEDTLPSFNQ